MDYQRRRGQKSQFRNLVHSYLPETSNEHLKLSYEHIANIRMNILWTRIFVRMLRGYSQDVCSWKTDKISIQIGHYRPFCTNFLRINKWRNGFGSFLIFCGVSNVRIHVHKCSLDISEYKNIYVQTFRFV